MILFNQFQTDFDADLTVKGSFPSFFILYQLMYKSRIILEDTDYSTFSGYLPDWLYYWSALSTKPPLPGFYNLPAGRTKKTWGMAWIVVTQKRDGRVVGGIFFLAQDHFRV